jgi:predicted phosphate transport protein (TIGR00153 family)
MRLVSHDERFREMYGEVAENLLGGARLLAEMIAGPPEGRARYAGRIRRVEHHGDELTRGVLTELHTTPVAPFDPVYLARLAARLDDVLDFIETAADRIARYQVVEPPAGIREQIGILVRAAELTADALPRMRKDREHLERYLVEINTLENDGDLIYRNTIAYLFGGDFDALTAMKLKEVTDQLEQAADAFEHVADAVEAINIRELGTE